MKNLYKFLLVAVAGATLTACADDLLEKQPLDKVSDQTFWRSESDAQLALTACYNHGYGWYDNTFWAPRTMLWLDFMAGFGSEKEGRPDGVTDGTLHSDFWVTNQYWEKTWETVARCNYFLDNIDKAPMNEATRQRMIAEIKCLRAYHYFYLGMHWGNVPLVTNVLTLEEANSVKQAKPEEIMSFAETELAENAGKLPAHLTADENGHFGQGAAYTILGRVLMWEKKWGEAAAAFKKVIDLKEYKLEAKYKDVFLEANEGSKEIVLAAQYVSGDFWHVFPQYFLPESMGGWHQFSPYNELVKMYECVDGKTIAESPLYDPKNPYDNRDPRLLETVMVNGITTFNGITYVSTPGSSSPDRFEKYDVWSGYCIAKFADPVYIGNGTDLMNNGGNFSLIRYPEVLLSYLESVMESGAAVSQTLLDETINVVRGRVGMPAVTATSASELRPIVRRERAAELALEGLHYYDILRWGTANEELNRQFHGMLITNDPANYTGVIAIDEEGYAKKQTRKFTPGKSELWPIPLAELNINGNLVQNPGY